MRSIWKLIHEETAATTVEYAVMLGLVLMACIAAIGFLGLNTQTLWSDNDKGLQKAFK
jgi:Flp pilus assembly pilin Flp